MKVSKMPTWAAALITWGWMPPMAYLFMDEPMRREALGIVSGLATIGLGIMALAMVPVPTRWRTYR